MQSLIGFQLMLILTRLLLWTKVKLSKKGIIRNLLISKMCIMVYGKGGLLLIEISQKKSVTPVLVFTRNSIDLLIYKYYHSRKCSVYL